jgi:hypothetical protein
MSIKLNCLACGHTLDLSDAYEDYDGEIRCWGCHTSLLVALHDGKLKSLKRGQVDLPPASAGYVGPPVPPVPGGDQESLSAGAARR